MKSKLRQNSSVKVAVLIVCSLLCVAGCGGGEGDDSGDGDGTGFGDGDGSGGGNGAAVTSSSAEDIADASVEAVQAILSVLSGGGSPSLSLPEGATIIVPNEKALTVTSGTSCSRPTSGTLPSSSVGTIYGTDISADGSGSCVIKAVGGSWGAVEGTAVAADCDSFSAGSTMNNIYFDGQLKVGILEATEMGNTFSVQTQISTPGDFLVGGDFDGNGSMRIIDLVINWIEQTSITVDISENSVTATYSDGVEGCLSVNGEAFNVSGYKTGSQTRTF